MGLKFRYPKEEERKRKGIVLKYECERRALTCEETLSNVIDCCKTALDEIEEASRNGDHITEYAAGIKSTYVEILQIIQEWEKKDEYGLNIDIESVYPVR